MYKKWPGICKRKFCACEIVYFYQTIKHYVLCFSCPNPFLQHPHLKKVNPDFPMRKFEDRLKFFEITNIYDHFAEFFKFKTIQRFKESNLKKIYEIQSESDTDFDVSE
jgi:hypothetical protein